MKLKSILVETDGRMAMKVLIISHNPITDYNGMGKTLLSLFCNFDSAELCQMYIYPTVPNILKCGSYYRVTDAEILSSFLTFRGKGREINVDEISGHNQLYENEDVQKLYRDKMTHRELKLIARKIAWTYGRWNTKEFRHWMAEQKPDIIFAAAGLSSFFYDVILKVSKQYHIPIVSYICDDFYFSTRELCTGILQRYYYASLRKKITALMKSSKRVIAICDSLSEAYGTIFQCPVETVFSGANIPIALQPQEMTGKVIRYFGNLQLNRYRSLYDIGQVLMRINDKYNTDYILEIYTGDSCPDELKTMSSVRVMSFVASDKMYELMSSATMLVHVESFGTNDSERVLYSISTKIADSLASGVCLLAYGPEEVASIQHLVKNECAVVVNCSERLEEELSHYLFSIEERRRIVRNALKAAMSYHSQERQSDLVRKVLSEVLYESSSS